MIERLRDLVPLLPLMEYRAVRKTIKDAASHIANLEAKVQEQEKHLAMLRAALLKKAGND